MQCYNLGRNFLQERKGKMIKVLVEGGGFRPVTGKLVDFDDAAIVLELPTKEQWMIDMDYVMQMADASEEEAEEMEEA